MIGWLRELLDISEATAKLIATGGLIVALLILRVVLLSVVQRRIDEPAVWYRTRKLVTYAMFVVAVFLIGPLWLQTGAYGTYIGLLSAGLAIALSDVIKNLAGWVFIVIRRPFRVGDRIEIAGHVGDIIDSRVFRFSMLEVGNWVHADQSTGRIMHVPNGLIFTEPLANYTEGFEYIWHEIPVLITFESDWNLAERIIQEVLDEHAPHHEPDRALTELRRTAKEYQIRYTHLTPAVYLTVKDSGVLLTGRLLVRTRRRRAVEDIVWKGILTRFAAEPTIDLAYPTIRTFLPDTLKLASRDGDG